jgi:hypothetical protein
MFEKTRLIQMMRCEILSLHIEICNLITKKGCGSDGVVAAGVGVDVWGNRNRRLHAVKLSTQ